MSSIRVEVVCAFPDEVKLVEVKLPSGATVRDALDASGMIAGGAVGMFGKVVGVETRLKDGDRVEIYRPLTADPKEQRRRRAAAKSKKARS
jgi:uncharacterized protein